MPRTKKSFSIPIRISIALLIIGMLFKILSWPLDQEIMIVSFVVLAICYSLRFYQKVKKKSLDYIKVILVLSWVLNGLFSILHIPYNFMFQVIAFIAFLTWFIIEGTHYFIKDEETERSKEAFQGKIIWNIVMILGTLGIVLGALFKFLNWEYAIPVLVSGCICITLYILRDIFVRKS